MDAITGALAALLRGGAPALGCRVNEIKRHDACRRSYDGRALPIRSTVRRPPARPTNACPAARAHTAAAIICILFIRTQQSWAVENDASNSNYPHNRHPLFPLEYNTGRSRKGWGSGSTGKEKPTKMAKKMKRAE